jgi:5,10-methylenetetrahydromethanopterin reductase
MAVIKLGVSLVCDRIREYPGWVRAIEEAGFDAIGVGDSPSLYPEVYTQATVVALNSSRVMFGPRVTNPVTRDPSVTASAIASVDELSGGRAVLGIGTGDSALHNIGGRAVSLDFLRDYVRALREMFDKGETIYQSRTIVFSKGKRRVPIYIAAHGPKSMRLAGEIGDGVIVGGGVSPEIVADAHEHIAAGAKLSGRKLEDLDIWWLMGASIAPTVPEAIDSIKTHLAAAANASFRLGVKNKLVPADIEPLIKRLIASYDFTEHEHTGTSKNNVNTVQQLGLTEYLAERFTIAGPPNEFAGRIQQFAAWGASQLWFTMPLPDKYKFLHAMRDEVMPRMRNRIGL